MLKKKAKFKIGDFVGLKGRNYPMQVTQCKYDYDEQKYWYFLSRVRDGHGFDAYESDLYEVDNESLIQDLLENLTRMKERWLDAVKERDEFKYSKESEKKLRKYYDGFIDIWGDSNNDVDTRELAGYGSCTVKNTLDILGIKIPGINAPEDGVSE